MPNTHKFICKRFSTHVSLLTISVLLSYTSSSAILGSAYMICTGGSAYIPHVYLFVPGRLVYHGPKEEVVPFFESLGFALPPRKGTADFLQEITSRKDQRQYWADPSKPYRFIPPAEMAEAFRRSPVGQAAAAEIASPPARTKQGLSSHCLDLTLFATTGA